MNTKQDFRGAYRGRNTAYLSMDGHRAIACGGDKYWIQAQLKPKTGWPINGNKLMFNSRTSLALPKEYMT